MTQVPLLQGTYADSFANFRTSLPVNLEPVITDTGLSRGFMRTAPGLDQSAVGPGFDRGSINWRDFGYRVMADRLVKVSGGIVTDYGSVGGGTDPASFDY